MTGIGATHKRVVRDERDEKKIKGLGKVMRYMIEQILALK